MKHKRHRKTDAGAVIREYVWDDDAPVAQVTGGVLAYLHTDQLGTPRLATNAAKTVVWRWNGKAFGESAPAVGTVTVNLRFPGQYFDTETGLHYNWHRYYDPAAGRYLSSDPIGVDGGTNTYLYVNGSPLTTTDPTGEIGIVGGLIGAGVEIAMQGYKNYKNGCDVLDLDNYDWWDVGVSAATGALAPGWLSVGKTGWKSGNAIKTLSRQLGRAQTTNRAAKIEHRISNHQSQIADALITQGAFQGAKAIGKAADGDGGCSCRR